MNRLDTANSTKVESLIIELNKANEAYRKGEPIISDDLFDQYEDTLRKLDPDNNYFSKAIREKGGKVALPVKMASLNKVKSDIDIQNWLKNKKIPQDTVFVLTPKYDGCALLSAEFKVKGEDQKAYTRGDGEFGQDVTLHYQSLYQPYGGSELYSVGEAIIPKEIFKKKYSEEYANARNMVSSLFNTKVPSYGKLVDVRFIRHSIYPNYNHNYDKLEQLELANHYNNPKIPYEAVSLEALIQTDILNQLFKEWSIDFDIDGIVIDVNDGDLRNQLGYESNGNPAFARAYKKDWEEIGETTIKSITLQVGRTGKVTPVGQVDPIILEGGTVTNVTLYNAKYVLENGINVGTKIKLKRSGGVIPKIVEVINKPLPSYLSKENAEWLSGLSTCKEASVIINGKLTVVVWDETKTDIYLKVPNDEQKIQQIAYFFKTIGVEDFGIPTITKFYEAGFDTIGKILSMEVLNFESIEGVGFKTAQSLIFEFEKVKEASFAKLADASGCFKGLGEKTIELFIPYILSKRKEGGDCETLYLIEENIGKIEGIGEKSWHAFIEGLCDFTVFLKLHNILGPLVTKSKLNSNRLKGLSVVFSGFRDKELEERITSNGGEVKTSVSSNTTYVLTQNLDSVVSKVTKAHELKIPVILPSFIDYLLNK